jgi:hypothetical protein
LKTLAKTCRWQPWLKMDPRLREDDGIAEIACLGVAGTFLEISVTPA